MRTLRKLLWLCLFLAIPLLIQSKKCKGETADRAERSSVRITLECAKTVLLPYEPLYVKVTLTNEGAVSILIPGRWKEMLRFEYKDVKAASWEEIAEWWRPSITIPPLPPVELETRESTSVRKVLYSFDPMGKALFEPGRAYVLRALMRSANPKLVLESNESHIDVPEIPKGEEAAYRELVNQKDLIRVLAPLIHIEDLTLKLKPIETFVEKYPNSVYSLHMRFSYVAHYGRGDLAKTELIQRYQQHIETTAPWLLEFQ